MKIMWESNLRSLTKVEKLELARRLFKEHYASCFWHLDPDLEITEADLPYLVRSLRTYGGREGFLAADPLR